MDVAGAILLPSAGATIPLRVRDKNGTVVAEGLSGKTIPVPAGSYHVGTILADGSEVLLDELVTVVAGQTSSPQVPAIEQSHSPAPAMAADAAPWEVTAERWRGDWLASLPNQAAGPLWTGEKGESEPVALHSDGPTILERDFGFDEIVIVRSENVQTFFILPLDRCMFVSESSKSAGAIAVELKNAEGRPRLKYSSPVDPTTNAFFEYVDNALLSESRAISADFIERSQQAMRSERSSLLCAVLSAYVLLRANQFDGLDRWIEQLVDLAPDMPDAYALQTETLARMGEHDAAITALRRGMDKGCPWFRSGLSYSLERLRLYIDVHREEKNSFQLSSEDFSRFETRKAQMERAALHLDTTALFTTFVSDARA